MLPLILRPMGDNGCADKMLSEILEPHFRRVSALYPSIVPGRALTSPEQRRGEEAELFSEISTARQAIRAGAATISRSRPLAVAVGEPKGAWAHIYYVSFHDPVNSSCPTEGFYPVFLLSADQKSAWLSVLLAAGSVGISGRGGWSQRRGQQLRTRAEFLGAEVVATDGWRKGPIELGTNSSWMHRESGSDRGAGRAYECGAIISKRFDPHRPPTDLDLWLRQAFEYFDAIYAREAVYIAASLPHAVVRSSRDQVAAAITGRLAEERFLAWVASNRPEWGPPRDVTDRIGLGFDVEFPTSGIRAEIKGCREGIEDIRMTEREWEIAHSLGKKYVLCIVTDLDAAGGPNFNLIFDPFTALRHAAVCQTRLQITYAVPRSALDKALNALKTT